MTKLSTRSIDRIEERIGAIGADPMRRKVLESAKAFKTSWLELGQALYAVWKDKLYKEWGFLTFEAYTGKEIGIRKNTALKLLKSYYFLEKEEPNYLQKELTDTADTSKLPSYEAVNVLRLAKDKSELDRSDYSRLKREVLDMGKDARDVKRDLVSLVRQREELDPAEAREKRRSVMVRRLLGTIKTLKTDMETAKMLSAGTIKDLAHLIQKIEAELGHRIA